VKKKAMTPGRISAAFCSSGASAHRFHLSRRSFVHAGRTQARGLASSRLQIFAQIFHVFNDVTNPPGNERKRLRIVLYSLKLLDGLAQQVKERNLSLLCLPHLFRTSLGTVKLGSVFAC
jgi:hypothetical protein